MRRTALNVAVDEWRLMEIVMSQQKGMKRAAKVLARQQKIAIRKKEANIRKTLRVMEQQAASGTEAESTAAGKK